MMNIKSRLMERFEQLKKEVLTNCDVALYITEDEENDGSVFYETVKKTIKYSIYLALHMGEMDECDEYVCQKFNLKTRDQLHFFIFYHEFYHVLQMNTCFLGEGRNGIERMLKDIRKKINEINLLYDKMEKSKLYREISWEKEADLFAVHKMKMGDENG